MSLLSLIRLFTHVMAKKRKRIHHATAALDRKSTAHVIAVIPGSTFPELSCSPYHALFFCCLRLSREEEKSD